ncbi:hypothetical protein [Alcaligenes faecalis]|uniref:hypothetical protein n=1 Tax=Alcaligenes faecalis TaxID=511 RepID=UPI00122D27CD|nr:hypothetical protein [Alcaligenes faecalis]KAA1284802.1 hypothetical protein D7S43_15280 [Alcaligenes faecalis]QRF90606.1 hypothetical protein CLH39_10340 [Alcaligenes faecalis]
MKTDIVFVKSLKDDINSIEFFRRVNASPEISRDFLICRRDASSIRDVIREWISENGISSLYNFHLTCDAIVHPGITVDEIEELILGFVKKMDGVKNLMIIDPYIYSSEAAVLTLFENMIKMLSSCLESVTFFTKSRPKADRTAMHEILERLAPTITIKTVETEEFHDRFWIDSDASKGLVMGTSLNGVTKKIALIDHLKREDVKQIIALANSI